jgi:HEAT repeat protein
MRVPARVLVGVLLLGSPGLAVQPEPVFEGKPMSFWVRALRETPADPLKAPPDFHKAPMALRKIGEPAVPALAQMLSERNMPNREVRRRAIGTLLGMGPKAGAAVPAVVQALEDRESSIRQMAALTLGQIGSAAGEVVPALAKALRDPDPPVRGAAATSLGNLRAQEALPALEEAVKDPNKGVQRASLQAIRRIQGKEKTRKTP